MTPRHWTMPPEMKFLRRFDPPANTSEELLKVATAAAKDIFYKNQQIVSGTFMFYNPLGNFTSICELPWSNTAEKRKVAYTFRKTMEAAEADRYAVMSEVWYYTTSAKARTFAQIQREDPAPSEHPDRKEGVMILVRDRTDVPLGAFFDIKRRINARPVLVEHMDTNKLADLDDMTFGKLYPAING